MGLGRLMIDTHAKSSGHYSVQPAFNLCCFSDPVAHVELTYCPGPMAQTQAVKCPEPCQSHLVKSNMESKPD